MGNKPNTTLQKHRVSCEWFFECPKRSAGLLYPFKLQAELCPRRKFLLDDSKELLACQYMKFRLVGIDKMVVELPKNSNIF